MSCLVDVSLNHSSVCLPMYLQSQCLAGSSQREIFIVVKACHALLTQYPSLLLKL